MKFRLLILKGLGLSLALASAGAFAANEATPAPPAGFEKAIFAGGCFWCVEHEFEGVSGIQSVVSGYVGGKNAMPTYKQVSAGGTGHAEAVEVVFDPKRISYGELLKIFWRNIDPYAQTANFVTPVTNTARRFSTSMRHSALRLRLSRHRWWPMAS